MVYCIPHNFRKAKYLWWWTRKQEGRIYIYVATAWSQQREVPDYFVSAVRKQVVGLDYKSPRPAPNSPLPAENLHLLKVPHPSRMAPLAENQVSIQYRSLLEMLSILTPMCLKSFHSMGGHSGASWLLMITNSAAMILLPSQVGTKSLRVPLGSRRQQPREQGNKDRERYGYAWRQGHFLGGSFLLIFQGREGLQSPSVWCSLMAVVRGSTHWQAPAEPDFNQPLGIKDLCFVSPPSKNLSVAWIQPTSSVV